MSWQDVLTGDAGAIARTLVTATIVYGALVAIVRLTGKRTVSKWNAFDLIVTVALGSTLASAILSRDVSALQGVAALAVLVLLQFAVTFLTVRSSIVGRVVKARPTLLMRDGEMLHDAMRRVRVPAAELRAAVRKAGCADMGEVAAAVLETDGSISVLRTPAPSGASALEDVEGWSRGDGGTDGQTHPPARVRAR